MNPGYKRIDSEDYVRLEFELGDAGSYIRVYDFSHPNGLYGQVKITHGYKSMFDTRSEWTYMDLNTSIYVPPGEDPYIIDIRYEPFNLGVNLIYPDLRLLEFRTTVIPFTQGMILDTPRLIRTTVGQLKETSNGNWIIPYPSDEILKISILQMPNETKPPQFYSDSRKITLYASEPTYVGDRRIWTGHHYHGNDDGCVYLLKTDGIDNDTVVLISLTEVSMMRARQTQLSKVIDVWGRLALVFNTNLPINYDYIEEIRKCDLVTFQQFMKYLFDHHSWNQWCSRDKRVLKAIMRRKFDFMTAYFLEVGKQSVQFATEFDSIVGKNVLTFKTWSIPDQSDVAISVAQFIHRSFNRCGWGWRNTLTYDFVSRYNDSEGGLRSLINALKGQVPPPEESEGYDTVIEILESKLG